MPDNQFATPATPYSLKDIVKKIIAEPDYAKFIHEKIRQARNGDSAAAAVVTAHFEPKTSELTALKIPAGDVTQLTKCTDPRTHFIDFANYV